MTAPVDPGGLVEPIVPVDPASVGMSAGRLADAGALMQRQFDEGLSPMLVAMVARHGKVVFTNVIGDQRPGGPPLTIDSVFPIASQTKPMTAAVIMCLVERGLVGITEGASLILPELADNHSDVLVHHLLTHTSGWNDDDHVAAREARLEGAIASVPEGTDPLTHIFLWPGWDVARRREPGELMQYCNFNYSLLGEIVRRVTGDTLDAAMREFLFEPLGMTSSAMIVGEELRPRVIERPAGIPFGPDHPFSSLSFNDPTWAGSDDGASGVHASAPDVMRFWQMILDGGMVDDTRVLSRDAVRVMTTNQIPGIAVEILGMEGAEASWGHGFSVAGYEAWPRFGGGTGGPHVIRHGGAGGIGGWIDPERGIVAVYFELITEINEFGSPMSWAAHRFGDVITSAIID
jgi:CubicO group peptidase (beta-lactamase class C family)